MNRPARFGTVLLVLLLTPLHGAAQAAETIKPQIDGLEARLDRHRAFVSFRVTNGFTEETLERIHSGLSVTFRHRMEVVDKRGAFTPTRVLARTVVETRAEYDLLTKQYRLTRIFRFPGQRGADPVRQENKIAASGDEMREWMTRLDEIELVSRNSVPIAGARLRLRVDSSLGRKYVLWIFPGHRSASAERVLEP